MVAIFSRKRVIDRRRKRKCRACTNNPLTPHRPLGPVFAMIHNGWQFRRADMLRVEAINRIRQHWTRSRRDISITWRRTINRNLLGADLDISAPRTRRQSLHVRREARIDR